MLKRKTPPDYCRDLPCSNVAVSCAVGDLVIRKTSRPDGYMTLKDNNKFIRDSLPVRKAVYFTRAERPLLKDFLQTLEGRAVITVLGHCIYAEGTTYWSFFNNEDSPVVKVWYIYNE